MSVHGKVGSSWEDIYAPSAKVGSTWEDAESSTDGVCAVYVKNGSQWRMAWPGLRNASAPAATDSNFGGTASATLQLRPDGRWAIFGANTSLFYLNWCENGGDTDKAGNAPTLFQWKWGNQNYNGQPTAIRTSPSDAENTWHDLTSVIEWKIEQPVAGNPDALWFFDVEIRPVFTNAGVITWTTFGYTAATCEVSTYTDTS